MAQDNGTRTANVELRKVYFRNPQDGQVEEQMTGVLNLFNDSKWDIDLIHEEGSTEWYRMVGNQVAVFLTLTGPNTENSDIEQAEKLAVLAAHISKIKGTQKWEIHSVDGSDYRPMTPSERKQRAEQRADGAVTYADVDKPTTSAIEDVSRELIGIDAQIRMILRYVETSIESEFKARTHGLLIGPPGCGKSQTLSNLKMLFPDEAVLVIDGTAMTSAGIIKTLDELETLPRFIFVEEIDKAPNDAVAVLLGLMDQRGQLRKTTFRKNIQKDCRVCVFATANSLTKIKAMQEGALFSRFANPITYKRPSPEQLRLIINMNLDRFGIQSKNRDKWIDKTLEFCQKWDGKFEADTMDPRFAIAMCVNGRDDLLGHGKFQDDMVATSVMRETIVEFN